MKLMKILLNVFIAVSFYNLLFLSVIPHVKDRLNSSLNNVYSEQIVKQFQSLTVQQKVTILDDLNDLSGIINEWDHHPLCTYIDKLRATAYEIKHPELIDTSENLSKVQSVLYHYYLAGLLWLILIIIIAYITDGKELV